SNAMFPTQAMPSWLQRIAAVNPLSFAVTPMRVVATQGWAWDTIWISSLVLLVFAAASITLAISRFNRSIA
ncbi:MAG: ABC transporter permease, partial [Syntrophomonadaceae bacterium]|nr:ABC transporter permease [Syntrophomonadaceae bacterium]